MLYLNEKSRLIVDNKIYKYEFLRSEINRLKKIICDTDINMEKPVAIAMKRSPELIISIFALLEIQIPFLIIDTSIPIDRCLEMLNQADVEHIIVDNINQNNMYMKKSIKFKCVENFKSNNKNFVLIEKAETKRFSNEIAYVLFTSGTTGKPKGVEVTRKGLNNFVQGIPQIINFTEKKTIISLTASTFDIFFLESILALVLGLTLVLATEDERKNSRKIESLVKQYDVDMMQLTPSMMQLLYLYDRELKFLTNIKEIMLGGEALPIHLLEILQRQTSSKIYNMYGPTETTIWSSVADLTNEKEVHIGKPIRNTDIYLMDDEMNKVPEGEIGEIYIGGDGLARGYINNQDLTKAAFIYTADGERLYKTGDFGIVTQDGMLKCLGRKDLQVKLLGHRIELEDIEENLKKYEKVVDCVVCFVSTEEKLICFYKAESSIEESILKDYLKERIPDYMIPSEFIYVSEFIYNASGKLDRNEMLKKHYKIARNIVGVLDENLENILGTIKNVISQYSVVEKIERDTKFEDLGMDSIQYAQLIITIEELYDMEFDVGVLGKGFFEKIGDMESYIKNYQDKKMGRYSFD